MTPRDYREDLPMAANTYRFCNDLRLENEGSIFPDKLLDERFLQFNIKKINKFHLISLCKNMKLLTVPNLQ